MAFCLRVVFLGKELKNEVYKWRCGWRFFLFLFVFFFFSEDSVI